MNFRYNLIQKLVKKIYRKFDPVPHSPWTAGQVDDICSVDLVPSSTLFDFFKIGIIFIDCDTYSSSKLVLDFIKPLIIKPVIVCFDDWKLNNLDLKGMGEYKSFNEFLENNLDLKVKEIKSYNRKSKTFLIWQGVSSETMMNETQTTPSI